MLLLAYGLLFLQVASMADAGTSRDLTYKEVAEGLALGMGGPLYMKGHRNPPASVNERRTSETENSGDRGNSEEEQ